MSSIVVIGAHEIPPEDQPYSIAEEKDVVHYPRKYVTGGEVKKVDETEETTRTMGGAVVAAAFPHAEYAGFTEREIQPYTVYIGEVTD